ncbi:hypothetical protein EMMF5_006587, partial [Cystobasidiomycetes sp. EMM_F5]
MLAYGEDMKMVQTGKVNRLVELMADVFFSFVCKDFVPFTEWLQARRIIPAFTKLRDAEREFIDYGGKILSTMHDRGDLDVEDHDLQPNLLRSLHKASKNDAKITQDHVITEAGAVLIAGSDTTSTAMTYGSYELAKNRQLQDDIRKELHGIAPMPTSPLSCNDLKDLPLFNAFLKETLRRWPTLPGPLERIVPAGGAVICGMHLPEGTEITSTAYTIHRNSSIFPDPDKFDPRRWLEETAEMRAAFVPFSMGPRNCPGMNLAWDEMRCVLGHLIRRYEISPARDTTDDSMSPVEHFFVVP